MVSGGGSCPASSPGVQSVGPTDRQRLRDPERYGTGVAAPPNRPNNAGLRPPPPTRTNRGAKGLG